MTNNQLPYQIPPKGIVDIIDAPITPGLSINSEGSYTLFLKRKGIPSIADMVSEELKLAGLRIDPNNFSPSRATYYMDIAIKDGASQIPVKGLPKNAKIRNLSWSADQKKLAFTNTTKTGIELWYLDLPTQTAHQLTKPILNSVLNNYPYRWVSDSKTLIFRAVILGEKPQKSTVPIGPAIQENDGIKAPIRTYQDLLKNKYDEKLFTYLTTTQIIKVDLQGNQQKIGSPGMYKYVSPSPDGAFLLVSEMKPPFSYAVPYLRFPFQMSIWDMNGKLINDLAQIPLAENIPKGFGAVRKGPRAFEWRADVPATLIWAEALDEGDPKNEVPYRDQLFSIEAPFEEKKQSIKTHLRYGNIDWATGDMAIINEWQWSNRQIITSQFSPDHIHKKPKILFNRSWEDLYENPGSFETTVNKMGRTVLLQSKDKKALFLKGNGDSPKGKFPFLDRFYWEEGTKERLWQSEAPYFDLPLDFDKDKKTILIRRESTEDPPNYYYLDIESKTTKAITAFPHPYEWLKSIHGKRIEYKRADGLQLHGKLYLPPNYNKEKDGPLPVLMWAYPKEYKDMEMAGQVKDSPFEFMKITSHSPLILLTQGYAIFKDFSMPVVGEGEEEPNETFIEQVTANAKAAIDTLINLGIAHPKRIAIGGHSYGAFMTANLLAHTDFFAAGIARSGAYNRSLTPFGFQSEERTYWEATETYTKISPFTFAHQIETPLLLIHGEEDSNSGTYPMQSERFYNALKGHGKKARLVMLPHEGHGYKSRESILHMLWEMTQWLNRFLK